MRRQITIERVLKGEKGNVYIVLFRQSLSRPLSMSLTQ